MAEEIERSAGVRSPTVWSCTNSVTISGAITRAAWHWARANALRSATDDGALRPERARLVPATGRKG